MDRGIQNSSTAEEENSFCAQLDVALKLSRTQRDNEIIKSDMDDQVRAKKILALTASIHSNLKVIADSKDYLTKHKHAILNIIGNNTRADVNSELCLPNRAHESLSSLLADSIHLMGSAASVNKILGDDTDVVSELQHVNNEELLPKVHDWSTIVSETVEEVQNVPNFQKSIKNLKTIMNTIKRSQSVGEDAALNSDEYNTCSD